MDPSPNPPQQPGASAPPIPPEADEDEGQPLILENRVEYQRPWLYQKQLDAIFDPARLVAIEASTKAGKTVGCIAWIVEQAMTGGGAGRNYWWIAPVAAQADIAYTRTLRFLTQGSFGTNRTSKTIVLVNGAIIWFKGADRPDTLYGEDVYAAVVDEASRFKESAWHAVRSTLTKTRGMVRLIGNVRGRRNWFFQIARRAEQGQPGMAYHKIIAYDAVAAGVLEDEAIAEAKNEYPEHVFRELYLAEPSDDGGNPFGLAAIAACIVPALSPGAPYVWGWDLAKSLNWTVGIALDSARKVCRLERWTAVDWDQTKRRIITITGRTPALVDSTGVGDPIVEDLQRAPGSRFEGFKFSAPSKQQIMEGLAVTIQSRGTTYPDGELVKELEQFEFELTRTGVRYSAPEGMQDDCVCALALANSHYANAARPLRVPAAAVQRAAQLGRAGLLARI